MTLLEVLTGLAVAGLLFAMLGQGVRWGRIMEDTRTRVMPGFADRAAADRLLRDLIERMDPGLTRAAPTSFLGGRHAMQFTSELPQGAGLAREADIRLEVDPHRRLVVRWYPRRGVTTGPVVPMTSAILTGVERLDISYWHKDEAGGDWVPAWTDPGLPGLIRLSILPVRGQGRPMPDIIVAPVRQPWRS